MRQDYSYNMYMKCRKYSTKIKLGLKKSRVLMLRFFYTVSMLSIPGWRHILKLVSVEKVFRKVVREEHVSKCRQEKFFLKELYENSFKNV